MNKEVVKLIIRITCIPLKIEMSKDMIMIYVMSKIDIQLKREAVSKQESLTLEF